MSDLAWAVKNGDLDQVKEMVEGKASDPPLFSEQKKCVLNLIPGS